MNIAIRKPFVGEYPMTQGFGENPEIYSQFGKPGHNGVDWALPIGTPVLAAADGAIVKIGWDPKGYGNYVILQHNGFQTLYAHLNYVVVKFGDNVKEGQRIGDSGTTGFSTGPHLHFELRVPGAPGAYNKGEIDPLSFLKASDISNNEQVKLEIGKTYTVKASELNVRRSPSLNAEILGRLQQGEKVTVEGLEGKWVKFSVFVHGDWLG